MFHVPHKVGAGRTAKNCLTLRSKGRRAIKPRSAPELGRCTRARAHPEGAIALNAEMKRLWNAQTPNAKVTGASPALMAKRPVD